MAVLYRRILVAMRTGSSTLNFLLGDHLGSNAITTSSSGVRSAEIRYMPWGTTRYTYGSSPTTMQYTGQRVESSLGLLFYNARWYDPSLGRFISPDKLIPEQSQGVQAWDRFAYANNNPVKYTDPNGKDAIPYDQLIQKAIDFFSQMGWELVGTFEGVVDKGIYTNGADMVFTAKDGQVLAVELKNVVSNVDLGTLGKNIHGYYGGGIERVVSSADRFSNSSIEQLRLESNAIKDAASSGNLQNALFTTADRVSQGAQNIYNGVYTSVKDNYVNVTKVLPTASAGALGLLQTTVEAVGGFLNGCETFIMPFFFYFNFNPLENQAVST